VWSGSIDAGKAASVVALTIENARVAWSLPIVHRRATSEDLHMRRIVLTSLSTLALTCSVLTSLPTAVSAQVETNVQDRAVVRRPVPFELRNRPLQFIRTELFFGTAKPDGVVTEAEFLAFLDAEVTPRFPDGLTLLKAYGQFAGEDGILVKEESYLLVLLYPFESAKEGDRKIEAIRRRYLKQFQQESVLRVDDQFTVRVSF
jgi:Protein of unknown function (DUF3574)